MNKKMLSLIVCGGLVVAGCVTTDDSKTMTYQELKSSRPATLAKVGEPKIDALSANVDSLQASVDRQADSYIQEIGKAKEYKELMAKLATTEKKDIPAVVGDKAEMLLGVIKKVDPEKKIGEINAIIGQTEGVATSATDLAKNYSSFSLDPKIIEKLRAINAIKSKISYTKNEATYLKNEYSLMLTIMKNIK